MVSRASSNLKINKTDIVKYLFQVNIQWVTKKTHLADFETCVFCVYLRNHLGYKKVIYNLFASLCEELSDEKKNSSNPPKICNYLKLFHNCSILISWWLLWYLTLIYFSSFMHKLFNTFTYNGRLYNQNWIKLLTFMTMNIYSRRFKNCEHFTSCD